MAIFRMQKKGRHAINKLRMIQNNQLSALAKAVLVFALSRPDNWVFSAKGIAYYFKESPALIRKALNELEEFGYLTREEKRVNGKFAGYEYDFYEDVSLNHAFRGRDCNENEGENADNSQRDDEDVCKPYAAKPYSDFSHTGNLNISINDNKTNINNKNINISINNPSINPYEVTERIKVKLEIECLAQEYDKRYLENIVSLITDVYMTTSPTVQISKDSLVPTEYVRERFDKLNVMHIEQILRSLDRTNPVIMNTRNYLLTSLINAVNVSDLSYGYGEY